MKDLLRFHFMLILLIFIVQPVSGEVDHQRFPSVDSSQVHALSNLQPGFEIKCVLMDSLVIRGFYSHRNGDFVYFVIAPSKKSAC